MERLKISDLELARKEDDIEGNFASVRGEYYIPQIKKTGFYKVNGCVMVAHYYEDLRELLAAKIMDRIDFPHADILLAIDENNEKGCLSINVLSENEKFVKSDKEIPYRPINTVEDFINKDLEQISSIPGITPEDIKRRKEYLIKNLLVSALIANTDIKMDNMLIIKNSITGKFRNPEYYDMGSAFIESNNIKFFDKFSSKQILEQLYKIYPEQIVPFGKKIQERMDDDFIKSLTQEEFFQDFSIQEKETIIQQLKDRVDFIEELNSREQSNFKFEIGEIKEESEKAPLPLKDKMKDLMSKQEKNTDKEKDEKSSKNKIVLDNGDECYLLETQFEEKQQEIDYGKSGTINIKNVRTPISAIDIIIVNKDDFVGYISASLYKDKTASLSMKTMIEKRELPEELEKHRDILSKPGNAIYTDEAYRGQGKGKELIKVLFDYLAKKGIKDVEVSSITDEIAENFYKSTGETLLGDKKAIYHDIGNMFSKTQNDGVGDGR